MSAVSDKFESDIAKSINKIPGTAAVRPTADTALSDVAVIKFKNKPLSKRVWVEVKMNHTDNLSNPRVFYKNGKWQTTYKTPAAKTAIDILNKSAEAKKFLESISKYTGIPLKSLYIPTTKAGLKEPGAVPLKIMKDYFNQPKVNRYISHNENFNIGKLVTEHYTLGKKEPAHYLQAGDDFYLISNTNPLKLPKDIPVLSGLGNFKVRISTRSEFYEVQAEIKISKMNPPSSPYSVKPGTKKKNPFI